MRLRRITKADFSAPAARSVEMTVVGWGVALGRNDGGGVGDRARLNDGGGWEIALGRNDGGGWEIALGRNDGGGWEIVLG
jgi:hypothetical protein